MDTKKLHFLFLSFLMLASAGPIHARQSIKDTIKSCIRKIPKISVCMGAAGLYWANKWFRIPGTFNPTVKNLNTTTVVPTKIKKPDISFCKRIKNIVQKIKAKIVPKRAKIAVYNKGDHTTVKQVLDFHNGVKKVDSNLITIFSRGIAGYKERPSQGGGLLGAYLYFRDNIIHTPCVSFDYRESRRLFDFGQNLAIKSLETVYNEVAQKNLQAKIIIAADCIGGKRTLGFVGEKNPANVETLVLESPLTSFDEFTDRIGQSYLKYLGRHGASMLRKLFTWYFPNLQPNKDDFWNKVSNIEDKNIFIGHRKDDSLVSDKTMKKLVHTLSKKNNVYLYITDDKTDHHSRIVPLKETQRAVNAFYNSLGYPCNEQLAREGAELLAVARKNALAE